MGVASLRERPSAGTKAISRRRRYAKLVGTLSLVALGGQLIGLARPRESSRHVSGSPPVQNANQLPVGLILPVRLENALEVKEAHPGTPLETRVMQEVPLPERRKISFRSVVKGSVLSVVKDLDGDGISVTFAFTTLDDRKQALSMSASLRAIASYIAVRDAQTPWSQADTGSPPGWSNTVQIGGDIRYGDGGIVRNNRKEKVGKGVQGGGVLVHVQANPTRGGCEGPIDGDDHPQALWVFSADACGVYGLKEIGIAHSGRSEPAGGITLHFAKSHMKLDAGTGMLLRVVERAR
jgi:hypothetical protein